MLKVSQIQTRLPSKLALRVRPFHNYRTLMEAKVIINVEPSFCQSTKKIFVNNFTVNSQEIDNLVVGALITAI